MSDLWTKKKKALARTDRFKITEDIIDPNPKKEEVEKLLTETEEFNQESELEEQRRFSIAQRCYETKSTILQLSCIEFAQREKIIKENQIDLLHTLIRSQFPTLRNFNRIVPWINGVISSWHNFEIENLSHDEITSECLRLLKLINLYIENPLGTENINNWIECKIVIRCELLTNLDISSYKVLINIEKEMSYFNSDVMYFQSCNEFFKHCIWTPVNRIRNGKDEKFPLVCNFNECGVILGIPKSFAYKMFVVRCLHMFDDYFTNSLEKKKPSFWEMNLLEYNKRIWEKKEKLMNQINEQALTWRKEREKRDSIINTLKHLIPSSSQIPSDSDQTSDNNVQNQKLPDSFGKDNVFASEFLNKQKLLSQLMMEEEKHEIEQIREYYKASVRQFECNLRMHHIIGGVYHLNLLKQPPQPKLLKDGARLRMIIGEDKLKYWNYSERYVTSSIKTGPVKQTTDDDDEDMESTPEGALLAKLVLVNIKLPDHVLWFDSPMPVLWDPDKNFWSQEHIYEVKFNEEKQNLSFRVGKMGAFGLASFKFNNLPFQSWELKVGDSKTEVIFTLTTSILALEFVIRCNKITLTLLENANTSALQELVGVSFEPRILVEKLRNGGVNIFPSNDAFLYVDGVQVKHRVTEDHLYHCMARLCVSYKFSWSRWNLMAGYKKFVSYIRDNKLTKGNELLVVTDQRTMIVENIVDIQNIDETIDPQTEIFADLLNFFNERDTDKIQRKIEETDIVLTDTVYYFLSQTKIMSYS